jgi:hypothetical protein
MGQRGLHRATSSAQQALARLRPLQLVHGWLAVILVAWIALLLAPDHGDRFAHVALGIGFGGLLARWLSPRPAPAITAPAPAPVARPFVYQPSPPPWESSTSL